MKITKHDFGQADSRNVYLFSLENDEGTVLKVTNFGAIITRLFVTDKNKRFEDVVLGYEDLESYKSDDKYFGALCGRYANRIAKGHFELDGKSYQLAVNNGPNALHGGLKGFNKVVWDVEEEQQTEDAVGITFSYVSKDMEEGYPGTLDVEVTYWLTARNEVRIDYKAKTDQATHINLTHHGYFNLNACTKQVFDHAVYINSNQVTEIDGNLIPTGELLEVKGTGLDFTTEKLIGEDFKKVPGGYDHNYILNKNHEGELSLAAQVYHKESGRIMEMYTTEPAVQFYTGNFLDGCTGKEGKAYGEQYGFCLEAQHYPDSPNKPKFPSTVLRPGDTYTQTTLYKFGVK